MNEARAAPPAVSDLRAEARLGEALAALVRAGLQRRSRLRLRLHGESMWPTIPAGSLVEVERSGPAEVRPGDVVIWQDGARLVAHRVLRKLGAGPAARLLTKGDNSALADQELAAAEVLGRVVAVCEVAGSTRAGSRALPRLEGGFWLARWQVRSTLGGVGRVLPAGLRGDLIRLRDRLGHWLSRGYQALRLGTWRGDDGRGAAAAGDDEGYRPRGGRRGGGAGL